MRIIIAGAGDVGFYIAKMLAGEAQNLIVIDKDPDKIEYLESHLDAMTIHGNASSVKVLREAGVSRADLLIAATTSDDTNIATAIIGKKLGAERTVARISNPELLTEASREQLAELGIDSVVSPEELVAREISELVKIPNVTYSFSFSEGRINLLEIKLDGPGPIVYKNLIETAGYNESKNFMAVAIQRDGQTIIPRGSTVFKPNDLVYFITLPDGISDVMKLTGKEEFEIRDIVILGASKTGIHAARMLQHKYRVKIVEINREKSEMAAEALPETIVINGDGHDLELLQEIGLSQMEAMVAVTGSSETNIISCLMARNHGVKKTIAMVENIEYIRLSQEIGIHTIINKKLIAAGEFFRYVRKGPIVRLLSIYSVHAEVLELEVPEKARITKKKIKDLNLPKEAIIAGVTRGDEAFITLGDFEVVPGDRVIVFARPDAVEDVVRFFKPSTLF